MPTRPCMKCVVRLVRRRTEEKTLESVAAASRKDLELVFLADTGGSDRDVDVVHESYRGTRKDAHRGIGRKVRCEVAVELKDRYGKKRDRIE